MSDQAKRMRRRERVEAAIRAELRRQAAENPQALMTMADGVTFYGTIDVPELARAVTKACDDPEGRTFGQGPLVFAELAAALAAAPEGLLL